jgi:hypothetical protein
MNGGTTSQAGRRTTMDIRMKSARAVLTLGLLSPLWGACQHESEATTAPSAVSNGVLAAKGNLNGAAGQMPAYYDGQLFTVNMKEQPGNASAEIIAKNQGLNEIYTTRDLDDEQEFFPVIDAIQGDGFNPMWHQILIVFNAGFTPHQFFSDEEVDAAASGPNPEITLVPTDEVYRCSVVGPKN